MKKIKFLSLAVLSLMFAAAFQFAMAVGVEEISDNSKKPVQQLDLYEKDPADWSIVEGGAYGKFNYFTEEEKFGFGAHGLNEGIEYTLINYGGWSNVKCMGSDTASDIDEDGDVTVNIKGTMPYPLLIEIKDEVPLDGAKIWLVLSSDVTCNDDGSGAMAAWNPTEYLFENELIDASNVLTEE